MEANSDQRFLMPFLPPRHLSRPRLLDRLDEAASAAITVLSAGAGAGKTLLLTEWARRQDALVPWLALTSDDDDPRRFWRLFLEAVHVTGQIGLPSAAAQDGVVDLLDSVFRTPGTPRERSVIVLDDAHLLTDPEILHGLDRIVRRWSHRVRLLVAARSDPLLPLHRYRLADQMRELRAADLAMTTAEAGQLLHIHGVELADEEVRTLTARTEGWSAGLRLAALRMEHLERPGEFVALLAMDEGSIGEYLTEEVLAVLPSHVQRLLIETSFLDDVTGPLAGAVTGIDGCHALLVDLARTNSFVMPADPARTTFRYHQLFREMLRQLARGRPAAAQRQQRTRAARWYLGEGDLVNALRWSVAADDPELARSVLARGGLAQIFVARPGHQNEALRKLARWPRPDDVPPGRLSEYAVTERAIVTVLADQRGAARLAERPVRYPDTAAKDPALALTAVLTELWVQEKAGRFLDLEITARQVLADRELRATLDAVPGLRARILLAQVQAVFGMGRLFDQDDLLQRALDAARAEKLPGFEVEVLSVRAFAEVCSCRFRHAENTIGQAESLLTGHTDIARPVILDLALARRAYIGADFAAMAAVLRRVTAAGTEHPDIGPAAATAFLQARLLVALGEHGHARGLLCDNPAVVRAAIGFFGVLRDRELAMIEIAQGRPRSALQILGRHRGSAEMLAAEGAVARAHLALGDLDQAAASVRAVSTTPSPFVDRPLIVEAALCDAEIAERRGDEGHAAAALDRALLIAGAEVVLPFVQATAPVRKVLARHHGLAARWPRPAGAGHPLDLPAPRRQQLPEGLTHREEAVLRLMTTSMSTAEIAEELCLSVNTIKTHLSAIYRKLSVGRRREAVFRARELELI